ncbi:anti-anti-sigma factor [Allocatelliglobosispora scoriae]|uniref:Anti-anti-sigma factor n=1 Tax=Allocatelliglobosispora scoriae TaxID=643052 RepID=A0A841C4E2_9ACTN|nr:STAS domain-containing protein [Allocatelliglobosispora scoriae]MBB5873691.1 anti-anti-sigma factor [Allocatelliglobosispora scoriae]
MTTPLTISSAQKADGTTSLTVRGEIDMSNTADLAEAISSAPGHVLLDFAEVDYLDSAGLAVLFANADRIELVANSMLGPVLEISGLTELVTVREVPSAHS